MAKRFIPILLLWGLLCPLSPFALFAEPEERLKEELRQTERTEWSLLDEYERLGRQAGLALQRLNQTRNAYKLVTHRIEVNERSIRDLERQIAEDGKALEKKMLGLYYADQVREITLLPGLANMDRFLINRRLLERSLSEDAEMLRIYAENIETLKQQKEELKAQKIEAESLLRERQNYSNGLQYELKKQSEYLGHIRKDRAKAQAYLDEVQRQRNLIGRLSQSGEGEKEMGPDVAQPKTSQAPRGFRGWENKLPPPIEGSLAKAYGQANEEIFQKGILLLAAPKARAQAVLHGRVVFAGPFAGMNKMVMIDHGRGSFSLYGNLESLDVSRGSKVKQGASLGRPDLMSQLGGRALYFELRYRKRAEDPKGWLRTD